MKKTNKVFILQTAVLIVLMTFCLSVWARSLEEIETNIHSADDALSWAEKNLYYKNVEGWDKAPSIQSIIDDGYGDCKMLAGVVADLLMHVKVKNWIVTIERKKSLHMFNIYIDSGGKLRVVDNLKLVPDSFDNWKQVLKHFGVNEYLKKHRSYEAFKKWFNEKIFPQKK